MHIPADHLNPRELRRQYEEHYSRPANRLSNHSVFRQAEPQARSARIAGLVVVAISALLMVISLVGIVRQSL